MAIVTTIPNVYFLGMYIPDAEQDGIDSVRMEYILIYSIKHECYEIYKLDAKDNGWSIGDSLEYQEWIKELDDFYEYYPDHDIFDCNGNVYDFLD